MLYDAYNRPVAPAASGAAAKSQPIAERLTRWEPQDRYEADASRALTPTSLDAIFTEANLGDPRAQARLSAEVEEKDWDSAQALQTRRAALLGLDWECRPGIRDDRRAAEIAEAAEAMLRAIPEPTGDAVGFDGFLQDLMGALLPGYALAEILWIPGGAGVAGFATIPASAIGFRESQEPLLCTSDALNGKPLVPRKFAFHRHRSRSGDATRGGLIRPLGWMYLFAAYGVKDLVRFAEKFGMPFVSARVDDSAWEKDRTKIAYLVRNFGSDGGAVFSKAVELELLQGATAGGDIYFRLLDYFGSAKTKVILGQTATSGDAGGFSKGQAQADVRQDLLESDARQAEATIRNALLAPWTDWNFGPDAPVPYFRFACEPAEDRSEVTKAVVALSGAGYAADPEWVEEHTGIPLVKGADGKPIPPARPPAAGALMLADPARPAGARRAARLAAAEAAQAAQEKLVASALAGIVGDTALMRAWLGPVQDALAEASAGLPAENPSEADQAKFKTRLRELLRGLPALYGRMDTAALEGRIAETLFAADANGRALAADGLRQ